MKSEKNLKKSCDFYAMVYLKVGIKKHGKK